MEPSARSLLSFSCAIVVAVFSIASRGGAQDETISGNLTVEGRADLITGPLSLGTSSFTDELDNETTAEGLTIHYSETPQIWSGGNFVQGRSTIIQRVGQELADFYWQTSEPDGLGGFVAVDLMKLSNEQLLVQPSILGQGTLNLLPNQTLSGGNGSILTLGLADNRYLSNAGGTIAGNLTITGSDVTINGSKVLTEADEGYIVRQVDGSFISDSSSYAYPGSSAVAIGHFSRAGESAVAIGAHTGMWEPGTSGIKSVAIGYSARAPGAYSIAIGESNWGGGNESIAIGREAATQADGALSFGRSTKANQVGQIVMGAFNVESVYSATPLPADSLFILGNGTADNARSNALVVRRNGDMEVMGNLSGVGGLTMQGTDNRLPNQVADHVNSILTKGIADGMYLSVGNDAGIPFRFGQDAVVTNNHSIVIGHGAKANTNAVSIGSYASNMGDNMASGAQSVALGYVARAPGDGAIGIGTSSWAAGEASVSLGHDTGAYTERSVAIGRGALAYLPGQVAIGNYNVLGNIVHTVGQTDPIFILGNGTADNARSNALVVRRNGDMEVKGTSLTVNGEAVLTEAALDAAIENVNLGGGNYLSKNTLIGLTYGSNTTAAAHSVALGEESVASGTLSSSAIGYDNLANQSGTHALGNYLVANRPGQIVLGNYNDFGLDSAGSATSDPADAIFVIGNGSADNARSNALVIKRGGDIALQGTSLTYNGAGLLTQASADTLYLSQTQATANYLTVTAAAAAYQTKPAMGIDFLTSEDLVTIQASIEAKIDEAELEAALENIDLSGNYLSNDPQVGLAYGTGSSAVAASSSAIGEHVEANMTGQVVVGRYNKVETASNPPTEDDPVFVVGVGNGIPEDEGERKNAVVVKRNGDVNVTGGVLRVMPAGDLSMDGFTSGPTPIDLE